MTMKSDVVGVEAALHVMKQKDARISELEVELRLRNDCIGEKDNLIETLRTKLYKAYISAGHTQHEAFTKSWADAAARHFSGEK